MIRLSAFAAATLLSCLAAGEAAAETFQCELPSLAGGAPQKSVFELSGRVLRRQGGSAYTVLVDDRDTLVAAAVDFAPEIALVVLVRSTGLLKITAFTNQPTQNPAFIGSCRK